MPLRRQGPSGRFSGPTRKPCLAFFGFLVSSAAGDVPASGAASSSRARLGMFWLLCCVVVAGLVRVCRARDVMMRTDDFFRR